MIFNFFKPKKNHPIEIIECFICCSEHGKSEKELLLEAKLYPTNKTINYPLLSLAEAYDCECHTSYAHNKCLITINKCPTCRKISKPNLYVITRYDYYLKFLLRWLKKDPSNISKLNWYMIYYLIFILSSLTIIDYNPDITDKIIPHESNISIVFSILVASTIALAIFILSIFNDYLKKYWLYNPNTKKYDVFNINKNITNFISDDDALNRLEIIRLQSMITQLQDRNDNQWNLIILLRDRIMRLEQQIS
jgi:hypothetical protein